MTGGVNLNKGMFISIEGLDTAGKSTQAELLANKLIMDGYNVKVIHFPNYCGEIGKLILKHLKGECKSNMESLQMLYIADQMAMKEHIEELIYNNFVVICDRYDLSTAVYYGSSVNDSVEGFKYIYNNLQKNLLKPDMTFIIDLPVEEISKRKNELDVFESNEKFMETNRALYSIASNVIFDKRIIVEICGTQSVSDIENTIYDKVKENL